MAEDWLSDFYSHMRKIDQHLDEKSEAFARACSDWDGSLPLPGDRVVVAAGLLSRGHLWIRRECEVLAVGSLSVKVASVGETYRWEEWIHPALIVDNLGRPKGEDQ